MNTLAYAPIRTCTGRTRTGKGGGYYKTVMWPHISPLPLVRGGLTWAPHLILPHLTSRQPRQPGCHLIQKSLAPPPAPPPPCLATELTCEASDKSKEALQRGRISGGLKKKSNSEGGMREFAGCGLEIVGVCAEKWRAQTWRSASAPRVSSQHDSSLVQPQTAEK